MTQNNLFGLTSAEHGTAAGRKIGEYALKSRLQLVSK
jgi:hypothetical protein